MAVHPHQQGTPRQPRTPCPLRAQTDALAHDTLAADDKRAAQQHLERCEVCRTIFRRTTAWFPRFRNYTIVERIGRGGFGEVYRAIHHTKERTEALKVLGAGTTLRAAYFENEVHLVARLDHPHIASLFEAHLTTPPLFYTMKLVDGPHLGAFLRERALPIERRLELFRTVVQALGYAHDQGVVHRDVKPQNILIDAAGQPHIVDFGIAQWLTPGSDGAAAAPSGTDTRRRALVGTPGYAAPEQEAGGVVDARADIYSLGALLFHLVTGEAPRYVRRTGRVQRLLRARRLPRADDLAAIISQCVAPLPEQRYPDCATLDRDVENYLVGRPVAARPGLGLHYRAGRVAALVLRNSPNTVRILVTLLMVAGLTLLFQRLGVRVLQSGGPPAGAALVVMTEDTLSAIRAGQFDATLPGLRADQRKSWRMLIGHVFEQLAGTRPRVIVLDFFFPDEQPAYDAVLLRGLAAAPQPVVVGCSAADLNGEPALSAPVRRAVHSWGLAVMPLGAGGSGDAPVALALRRGFNPWLPTLPLAAFAAARAPDADVQLVALPVSLELRYRLHATSDPNVSHWKPQTDTLALMFMSHIAEPQAEDDRRRGVDVRAGDDVLLTRFDWAGQRVPAERRYTFEQVLAANPVQRRQWLDGRPVVICATIRGLDEFPLRSERVWGAEVVAAAVNSLVSGAQVVPLSRTAILLRVLAWAGLAAVIAGRWRPAQRVPLAQVAVGAAVLTVGGAVLGTVMAVALNDPLVIELCLGLSVLLVTAGPVLLAQAAHVWELQLTPFVGSADRASTLTGSLALEVDELSARSAAPPAP